MCAEHGFDHMCLDCESVGTDCVCTGEEIINSDEEWLTNDPATSQGYECVAQEGGA